jgi:predicted RNase H-like nuclease (RuvC/YqgF family)
MSVSDVIEMIALYGRPLIVSTDVRPIPGTVEKIRRSFNAISGEPDISLATEEKIELAKPYGYRNDHERDAIAAAAHTVRKFKNKFDQIRKRVPSGIDVDEAIALVMKGDTIDNAVAKLTGRKVMPEVAPGQKTIFEPDEKSVELTETIKRQQETIDSLRTYLEELKSKIKDQAHHILNKEKEIQNLKAKTYSKVRKAKEMRIRDEKIRMLEKAIKAKDVECIELAGLVEELKRVRTLETSGRTIPVKVVPAFTKEALAIVKGQYGLKPGDVLFFKDASGGGPATVDILVDAGIRAVVFRGEMAHIAIDEFYKKELPFIEVRSVRVHYVDDFGVVDPEELETCEARFREELTSRRIKEKEQLLDNLLEEYKSERRRA